MDFTKLVNKGKTGLELLKRQQEGLRRVAGKREAMWLKTMGGAKSSLRPGKRFPRFVWMGTKRLQSNVATVHE